MIISDVNYMSTFNIVYFTISDNEYNQNSDIMYYRDDILFTYIDKKGTCVHICTNYEETVEYIKECGNENIVKEFEKLIFDANV